MHNYALDQGREGGKPALLRDYRQAIRAGQNRGSQGADQLKERRAMAGLEQPRLQASLQTIRRRARQEEPRFGPERTIIEQDGRPVGQSEEDADGQLQSGDRGAVLRPDRGDSAQIDFARAHERMQQPGFPVHSGHGAHLLATEVVQEQEAALGQPDPHQDP